MENIYCVYTWPHSEINHYYNYRIGGGEREASKKFLRTHPKSLSAFWEHG